MLNLTKTLSNSKQNRPPLLRVNGDFEKKLRWMIGDGLHAVFMFITPSLGKEMMKHNVTDEWHNRPESSSALQRFAAAMERGWVLTGEPIIFSKSGRLLNGQHRLLAGIQSDVGFPTLVVFGIDDESFKYMDIGTRRTAAHIFSIENVKNYAAMAAASKVVIAYDRRSIGSGEASGVKLVMENTDLLDWYHKNERLQHSLKFGQLMNDERFHSLSVGTALHYICARKHRNNADEFFQMVGDGVGAKKGDPEFYLRKVLNDAAKDEKKRIHWATRAAFTVDAWNAARRGQNLRSLVWRTETDPSKPFPLAI